MTTGIGWTCIAVDLGCATAMAWCSVLNLNGGRMWFAAVCGMLSAAGVMLAVATAVAM